MMTIIDCEDDGMFAPSTARLESQNHVTYAYHLHEERFAVREGVCMDEDEADLRRAHRPKFSQRRPGPGLTELWVWSLVWGFKGYRSEIG